MKRTAYNLCRKREQRRRRRSSAFITAKRSRILPSPESDSAVANGSGRSWWSSLATAAEEIQNEGIKEPGSTDHCSKNSHDSVTRAPTQAAPPENPYPGGRIKTKVLKCHTKVEVQTRKC